MVMSMENGHAVISQRIHLDGCAGLRFCSIGMLHMLCLTRQLLAALQHEELRVAPELGLELLVPELQAVGGQHQHVACRALVEALHESKQVERYALGKLLPAGQPGPLPLQHLRCIIAIKPLQLATRGQRAFMRGRCPLQHAAYSREATTAACLQQHTCLSAIKHQEDKAWRMWYASLEGHEDCIAAAMCNLHDLVRQRRQSKCLI